MILIFNASGIDHSYCIQICSFHYFLWILHLILHAFAVLFSNHLLNGITTYQVLLFAILGYSFISEDRLYIVRTVFLLLRFIVISIITIILISIFSSEVT